MQRECTYCGIARPGTPHFTSHRALPCLALSWCPSFALLQLLSKALALGHEDMCLCYSWRGVCFDFLKRHEDAYADHDRGIVAGKYPIRYYNRAIKHKVLGRPVPAQSPSFFFSFFFFVSSFFYLFSFFFFFFAPRSVRRPRLTLQAHPGPRYRCGKST